MIYNYRKRHHLIHVTEGGISISFSDEQESNAFDLINDDVIVIFSSLQHSLKALVSILIIEGEIAMCVSMNFYH